MSDLFGIAAAASAVSAPLTKLVECTSAGLGRLYEPVHQRRMNRVAADSAVLIAEADAAAEAIKVRAIARLTAEEMRHQQNREAITEKAAHALPVSVSDKPVDSDWVADFFSSCENVSREEMQGWWARLLASEVAQPGSFSRQAMNILRSLDAGIVGILEQMPAGTIHVEEPGGAFAFVPDRGPTTGQFRHAPLSWGDVTPVDIERLIDVGLIRMGPLEVSMGATFHYFDRWIRTRGGQKGSMTVPHQGLFTGAGRELLSLSNKGPNKWFLEAWVDKHAEHLNLDFIHPVDHRISR